MTTGVHEGRPLDIVSDFLSGKEKRGGGRSKIAVNKIKFLSLVQRS